VFPPRLFGYTFLGNAKKVFCSRRKLRAAKNDIRCIRQTSSKEKKSVSRFAFFFEALISEREEVVIGACEFAPPRV
jgi:hypothetical protein